MTMGAFSPRRAPVLDRLIQLPGAITQGDDDRFGHPTFEEGPKRTTWAARRDPSGRETLEYSESSITNVAVRFYTVRYDATLAAGQQILDEQGNTRSIIGSPAETTWGRDRFLELTCELIA